MCLFAAGIFCNQSFWKIALAKIGFKPLMVSKALQYSANLFVLTVLVWLSFSLLYIYRLLHVKSLISFLFTSF